MKRLLAFLDKTLDVFTIIMTLGIVVCVSLQVLFRFVLEFPAPWTEEIARYMFVYLTFIGSAIAVREKTHITIEVLVERLPLVIRTFFLLFVQFGIVFFLIVLMIGSWYMVQNSGNVTSSSLLWLKMSHIYFGVFLGSVLMIFYSILRIFDIFIEFTRGQNSKNKLSQISGEVKVINK